MPNRPAKILYVDDDPALGRLVQKVLGRMGRDIEHLTCAEEGLKRLEAGDIDVLVLDHYLSDGTGLAMLEQVAAREDAPPVVYVTGSTEAAIAVAALKAGAADYVLKTVGEDFLELLSNAVEQPSKPRVCGAHANRPNVKRARQKSVPNWRWPKSIIVWPTRWHLSPRSCACRCRL